MKLVYSLHQNSPQDQNASASPPQANKNHAPVGYIPALVQFPLVFSAS
jgi:hypothetical protein